MWLPLDYCTYATPDARLDHGSWRHDASAGSAFAELPSGVAPVYADVDGDGALDAISPLYCSGGGTSWRQVVVAVASGGRVLSWTDLPTDEVPQRDLQEKPHVTALTSSPRGIVVDYHAAATYRALLRIEGGKLKAAFDPDFAWNEPRLTAYGFGALRTGMTLDEAEAAHLITRTRGTTTAGVPDPRCDRIEPAGDAAGRGISLDRRDGKIAQIVAHDRSVVTFSGAYVGMTETQLKTVYGDRITKKDVGNQMMLMSAYVLPADGANLIFFMSGRPGVSEPVSSIVANLTDQGDNVRSDPPPFGCTW